MTIHDHKDNRGEYNIHLYYVLLDGKRVKIAEKKIQVASYNPQKLSIPSISNSGVYRFKGHASVRPRPDASAEELAYYSEGDSVNYDSVLLANNHYWISYIAASGQRRYISIT